MTANTYINCQDYSIKIYKIYNNIFYIYIRYPKYFRQKNCSFKLISFLYLILKCILFFKI